MKHDSSGDFKKVRNVTIDEGSESQRIDNFLRTRLKGVPKSHIYRILRRGEVRVNKGRIRPDYKLRVGDVVRVPPLRYSPETLIKGDGSNIKGLPSPFISLYEDKALLVLNKPAGMAVHGGSGLSFGVIEALRAMRPRDPFLELVHRLDRGTSGCLVVAKKRSALRRLHALLRDTGVEKTYLALVKGGWTGGRRRVDVPLRKNVLRSGERMVQAVADGKPAITVFEPLSGGTDATLVMARLVTGRTHQIRVHGTYIGHPVAGDEKYGDEAFNRRMRRIGPRRLFLHAWKLCFPHPDTEKKLCLQAPLGGDLLKIVERLGLNVPNNLGKQLYNPGGHGDNK